LSAEVTIGPRHTMGCSTSTRKPIDMATIRVGAQGMEPLAVSRGGALALQTEHDRLAGAVDVGIQQT
jgi:hypothetical protein